MLLLESKQNLKKKKIKKKKERKKEKRRRKDGRNHPSLWVALEGGWDWVCSSPLNKIEFLLFKKKKKEFLNVCLKNMKKKNLNIYKLFK